MAIFCEYYWEGFYVGKVSTYCQEMGCIFYFTTFSLVRSVSEPYKTSPFPQKMENKVNILRPSIRCHVIQTNIRKTDIVVEGEKCSIETNAARSSKTDQAFSQRCDFYCFDKDSRKLHFCNYFPFWDNYWIWVKMQQFCENSVWQKPRPGLRLFAGLVSLPLPRHYHPADC